MSSLNYQLLNTDDAPLGVWGLREKAREAWDHSRSNKVVYLPKAGNGNGEFLTHVLAEKYLNGDVWFDVNWTEPGFGEGDTHYHQIIEQCGLPIPVDLDGKLDVNDVRIRRDESVFVETPEFIELPEGVIPVGVASIVWLKAVHDRCHCGWEQSKPLPVSRGVFLENKEGDISPLLLGKTSSSGRIEMSEVPRKLIQRSAKATHKVADKQGDVLPDRLRLNQKVMTSAVQILLFGKGVRLTINPLFRKPLQGLQVNLCPAGFHFNMVG